MVWDMEYEDGVLSINLEYINMEYKDSKMQFGKQLSLYLGIHITYHHNERH